MISWIRIQEFIFYYLPIFYKHYIYRPAPAGYTWLMFALSAPSRAIRLTSGCASRLSMPSNKYGNQLLVTVSLRRSSSGSLPSFLWVATSLCTFAMASRIFPRCTLRRFRSVDATMDVLHALASFIAWA